MAQSYILLVDDESDVVAALQFRLKAEGYRVETAGNGDEALEKMRTEPADLILADFMMPEMNGIELTRAVRGRAQWFDTKILLISANPDPEFRRRALDLGAEEFLSKTLGPADIIAQVRKLVPAEGPEKAAPEPEGGLRREISGLTQSLTDILAVARATGELNEVAEMAVGSAVRIAENIRKLCVETDSHGR